MQSILPALSRRLYAKSVAAVAALEHSMKWVVAAWVAVMSMLCGLRVAFAASPVDSLRSGLETGIPYVLIVAAPVAVFLFAWELIPRNRLIGQPQVRLARIGKWRSVDCVTARDHRLFGPTGLMASLLIGMLINVPLRSAEFLAGVPAVNGHSPDWAYAIFTAMTADLVLMNCLYVFAFVLAIRNVPSFPRFLLLVWGIDILSQLGIAQWVVHAGPVPGSVADALAELIAGNIKKTLISAAIWLPYLILSDRVNLTYRGRVRA